MANFEVLSLDPTTPQIRAPGAGDGYSVPRDMTVASGANLTLSGGTANGVLYLNGSKVATSGSALTFDGSTLTNTGNSTGTIFNAIVNTDAAGSSITDERIVFAMGGSLGFGVTGWANAGIVEAASTGGLYLGAFNGPINFATGASARNINMTLTAAGNLGIGTTSPAGKLQVRASTPTVYVTSDDTGQGHIYFGGTTDSDAGRITYSDNADAMWFSTDNTERARITSGGDLLVGTTSSILTGVTTSVSSNGGVGYAANNVNAGTLAYTYLQLGNANSSNRAGIALLGSGYTASGLIRQDGVYMQCGGAGGITLNTEAAQPIYFGTNNTERARITATGELLVGTTSNQSGAVVNAGGGLGTSNVVSNRFATVEYGSGASGTFTTITISFTVNATSASVILETQMSGFSGVYLDRVDGAYSNLAPFTMRNNASAGTTAVFANSGGGVVYTLTITTSVTHPVVKVKATVGGLAGSTTLPTITFA